MKRTKLEVKAGEYARWCPKCKWPLIFDHIIPSFPCPLCGSVTINHTKPQPNNNIGE